MYVYVKFVIKYDTGIFYVLIKLCTGIWEQRAYTHTHTSSFLLPP